MRGPGVEGQPAAERPALGHLVAEIGLRFADLDEPIDLAQRGEVMPGLRRHAAPARDDARQRVGQLADRHEPATFLLFVAHRTPSSTGA